MLFVSHEAPREITRNFPVRPLDEYHFFWSKGYEDQWFGQPVAYHHKAPYLGPRGFNDPEISPFDVQIDVGGPE